MMNGMPIKLLDFINDIENQLKIIAKMEVLIMQKRNSINTWTDVTSLVKDFEYSSSLRV